MFLRLIISLIALATTFTVFLKVLPGLYFIAILVSILDFYIMWKILGIVFNKKAPKEKKHINTDERNIKLQNEGITKLKNIRSKTRLISDNNIAEKIQKICKIGFEIFDYIDKNPDDIKRAKQFINYYLDTTEKIVLQYVELSEKKNPGKEVTETIAKVEAILDSIYDTYKKQLHNLLEDDLLDLNVEIQVLEKTMQLEG